MNTPAKITFGLLGFILVLFSLVIAIFPVYGIAIPDPVTKHLDALIVAFVGMLATLGRTAETKDKP